MPKFNGLSLEIETNNAPGRGLRQKAKQILTRRAMVECQANQINGNRIILNNLVFQRDQLQTNIEIVNCMRTTTEVMKEQVKRVSLKLANPIADANEITDILRLALPDEFFRYMPTPLLFAPPIRGLEKELAIESFNITRSPHHRCVPSTAVSSTKI
jgi:hypothetical protein